MDKPDLVFISTHKTGRTRVFAAFDPLSTLQTQVSRIQSVLNAIVPKIEYWSEFHLPTLWVKILTDANFILIYFENLWKDRRKAWKTGGKQDKSKEKRWKTVSKRVRSLPYFQIKMRNLTIKWHTRCSGVLVLGIPYVVVFLFGHLAHFV